MFNEAKKFTSSKKIIYQNISVEKAKINDNEFDIVVSSLAFHYVEDYAMIVRKIVSWLKPNGYLIFSVEHPICTAHPEASLSQTVS